MSRFSTLRPGKIVVGYATGAAAWILCSDAVLGLAGWRDDGVWYFGTTKGLLFVATTSLLLHVLLRRWCARTEAAEAALREGQLRWEAAIRATGDGVWDWRVEENTAEFSPRCRELLGFAPGEPDPPFAAWRERVHPADVARMDADLERHFGGGSEITVTELRVPAPDGSWRWLQMRGRVIERGPDGRPRRMVGVTSDVTQRRHEQDRAAAEQALTQAVVANSPVGIISYHADGRTVSANLAAARIVGTDQETMLGLNFRQLESWEKHGLLAAADRALAERRVVELSTDMVTTFGRHVSLSLRFAPFVHEDEERLLLVMADETEKHRALSEVHLIHSALHSAPVAWMITDATGTIEWVNPAFTTLTGYAAAEAIGCNPRLLHSGRHDAAFYRRMWETITRGGVWDGAIENRRKDGTIYHERMVIAPVHDAAGTIRHFVAMKHDTTAEHGLEQQLARTQRLEAIGLLASGIAHDLNNVLAPIVLSMELLKMKFPQSDARATLQIVEQSARRGAGIVRQVLTFARGLDGERGEVSARSLLKDVARLAEETFPRNIELQVQVAPDLPEVTGDVTQLHQVLLNLAVNARDAMPEGGRLTLRGEVVELDEARVRALPRLRPGPHVALSVADTGPGIAPEVLERIFEPFFTTKARGKGTGLGLSTAHGIVKSHGGAIEVRTAPGQGAEFAVFLPPAEFQTGGTPAGGSSAPPFVSGAGRRVLVVDDELAVLDVAGRVLRQHGFDAHLASDGGDALAVFRRWDRWDLAVVDHLMPGLDGVELAAMLQERQPTLPVIFMSGAVPDRVEEDAPEATPNGAVRLRLAKPFTEAELLAAIAHAYAAAN